VTVLDRDSNGEMLRGHFVYLGFAEESGGAIHVKVGRSSDPYRRFLALSHASPIEIKLFRCVRLPYLESSKIAEKLIHRGLAEFRSNGEWYRFDARIPEHKQTLHRVCRGVLDKVASSGWHWDTVHMKALRALARQNQAIGRQISLKAA